MKVVEVEVEVISEEIIKPSSTTPNHLRRCEFSFLDQINPPVYAGLVLFFEFNPETQPTISEISKHLKKSLSEVLSLYYPLAGRVKAEDHFVDCNDHGVPFLEAQVTNCRLCDVLDNIVPGELNKLVPFELDDVANEFALGVQLNVFGCGGFVVGLCTTHKLADALSMLGFSKTWAAVARGVYDRPQFVSATLFPAKEFIGFNSRVGITKNKVTKRFVFDASTIEDLRAKYTCLYENDEIMKRPMTRVETLSAFIWRRFVEATKDNEDKLHTVNHAVNLRPKFDPPLPPSSFGNLSRISTTNPISLTSHGDRDRSCIDMMREVRVALSKIDNEYVKSLQKGDEHLSFIKKYAEKFTRREVVTCSFTSLCRFPLYDNDFGWGSPTWVGLPALTFKNLVLFVDTKEGDGIEAYISLAKEAMAKFENDSQILSRVSTVQAGLSLRSTRLVAKL